MVCHLISPFLASSVSFAWLIKQIEARLPLLPISPYNTHLWGVSSCRVSIADLFEHIWHPGIWIRHLKHILRHLLQVGEICAHQDVAAKEQFPKVRHAVCWILRVERPPKFSLWRAYVEPGFSSRDILPHTGTHTEYQKNACMQRRLVLCHQFLGDVAIKTFSPSLAYIFSPGLSTEPLFAQPVAVPRSWHFLDVDLSQKQTQSPSTSLRFCC